jgi:hypothetical protein
MPFVSRSLHSFIDDCWPQQDLTSNCSVIDSKIATSSLSSTYLILIFYRTLLIHRQAINLSLHLSVLGHLVNSLYPKYLSLSFLTSLHIALVEEYRHSTYTRRNILNLQLYFSYQSASASYWTQYKVTQATMMVRKDNSNQRYKKEAGRFGFLEMIDDYDYRCHSKELHYVS